MKYSFAILEDDLNCTSMIENELGKYFKLRNQDNLLIYKFQNPKLFLNSRQVYDLVFLDVKLPEISGIEVKKLIENDTKIKNIVFVTNYQLYMKEAFGRKVIAYLLKDEIYKLPKILNQILDLDNKKLTISGSSIELEKIYYIKASRGYSTIYTKDKEYIFCINLTSLKTKINDSRFMIIHRSYMVNFKYIKTFNSKSVTLYNDVKLSISRNKLNDFKNCYHKYLMS